MLKQTADLDQRLAAAGQRLRRLEGRLLALRLLPPYALFVACWMVLDLILHLPPAVRLAGLVACLALGLGGLAFLLWYGWKRPVAPRRVVRHLESRDPELGSGLINYLDLADTVAAPDTPEITRRLAASARDRHARSMDARELHRMPHVPRLPLAAKRFGYLCLAALIIAVLAWPVLTAQFPRLLDPYGGHPPFSLTGLSFEQPTDEAEAVTYGQPLTVRVGVRGHRPNQVELIYWPADRPEETYRLGMLDRGEDGFVQQIGELTEALTLRAQTPDGRSRTPEIRVPVRLTPQLEAATVEIIPPAYTGLPPSKRSYDYRELRALPGSTVRLTLASNRPLAGGHIRIEHPLDDSKNRRIPMEPVDESRVSGSFVAEQSAAFVLGLTDRDGLESAESPRGAVTLIHDRAPAVAVTRPDSSSVLSMDASLDVRIEAHDDYGLRELRVHRAVNGIFGPPQTIPVPAGERRLAHDWSLDFSRIGVRPGDVVSLYAEVLDNRPEPQLGRSELVRIAAVSVADYNRLLRQEADLTRVARKYEALTQAFDAVMERQDALREKAEALQKSLADAATEAEREALMDEFDALMAEQDAINAELDQLARQLAETVRENPLYDVESDFRERFKEEAAKLHEAAARNRHANRRLEAMRQAGEATTPEQQAQAMAEFAEALQAQREALGQGGEATETAHETMREMAGFHEMVKNFNRFASLANLQQNLAEQTAAFDRPGRLSREDQLALRDRAAEQQEIAAELALLTEKMRRDANAHREAFPQAAQSSLDFADAVEAARAPELGRKSTDSMLAGDGKGSAALSAAMSEAMQSLLTQCSGGMGEMAAELDRRLSAQSPSGSGGQTFQQMMENLQMRYPAPGSMSGMTGTGRGGSAAAGYSVRTGPQTNLYGNESLPADASGEQTDPRSGQGTDGQAPTDGSGEAEGPGTLGSMREEQRRAESLPAESLFIEQDRIIDAYFKKITEENE